MRGRNRKHITERHQVQPLAGPIEQPPQAETQTLGDLRAGAAFLDQQGEVHHADSLRLYLKASEMNEMAALLHAQAHCLAPKGEMGPAQVEACRLYHQAQTLFGAVDHLYTEASQTHLEANRLAVTVMTLHGDTNPLVLDADRAQKSAEVLRSEVGHLSEQVFQVAEEIGHLHSDLEALFGRAVLDGVASGESEEEARQRRRRMDQLYLEADRAETEADLLREKSADAHRKAEHLRAEAEQLLTARDWEPG